MGVLSYLEPDRVFYYFEEISNIPRGSYHTKEVSDYCVSVARKLGLSVRQDAWNNVVIHKAGSKECTSEAVFMLQGHLDMVCEKQADCKHDFENEGLCLLIDGDYIKADGTTLGGDDGIAIAIALAVLEDDSLIHPPLEVVFTTEEEVGMDGAIHLDTSDLTADYLLNLDSEDEGILTVSCAGGSTIELHKSYEPVPAEGIPYNIWIHGLQGGHSGVEIHKGRCNSNKVMSTILLELKEQTALKIVSVTGGTKHNAIPAEAEAEVLFSSIDAVQQAEEIIRRYQQLLTVQYQNSDPDIRIEMQPKPSQAAAYALRTEDADALLQLLARLPDGVLQMSQEIKDLPETSLNLAIVRTMPDELYIELSNRSSNPMALEQLEKQLQTLAGQYGFSPVIQSHYPGWQYRKDSVLRDAMVQIYEEMFGKKAIVEAIHAGLECGILLSKLPKLDIVSTGPDILDIHTPNERMSISSVARTYAYVVKILKYFAFV